MPLRYSLLLATSLSLNVVLWTAYKGRVLKYKKLYELAVYMDSMLEEHNIELSEFDRIAINQIVRNNACK